MITTGIKPRYKLVDKNSLYFLFENMRAEHPLDRFVAVSREEWKAKAR